MADSTITGNFPDVGEAFQFNVNGLATQKQMEKLIQLTQAMAKRIKADIDTGAKVNKEQKEQLDNLEELSDQQKKQIKQNKEFKKAWDDLAGVTDKLRYGWKNAIKELDTPFTRMAGATGFLVGSLTSYADSISGALKMGVSGEIMDFAIAAKTAGVSMTTLTKALSETGGGFASLGNGATDGAKNFASLVSSVRSATQSVGNLGMTNEELAMFTAQQTKVAVSQGFKGRAAQDAVIKNSQALGKELDDLANRTGKNVLEMAAAAAKLASDPIVSTFVKSAQSGSQKVSEAVNSFAAGLTAQFGEKGAKVAEDALKSALGGLPFAVTQTGKNLIMSSQATYYELERQAAKAKRGDKITEEDRKKLNDTVLQEVAARGDQLRMMAQLEGPAGESARQILEMAREAEFYNSAEGRKRREQDKSAQEFNAAIREFQANLQALAIPFLKLINGINWTAYIDILNGFTVALGLVLKPLSWLGSIIGDSGAGTVVGVLLALMGVVSFAKIGFDLLKEKLSSVVTALSASVNALKNFQASLAPKSAPKDFIGPRLPEGPGVTKDGTTKTPLYKAGYQVGEFVNKFSTELKFATLAVTGLGLASLGTSMLEEDSSSVLGNILFYGGRTAEVLGTWVPIITGLSALFPTLATTLSGWTLAVGMQTNMMLATMSQWATTAIGSITSFAVSTGAVISTWASTAIASIGAFATRMIASTALLLPALGGLAVAAWTAAAPFLPLIAAVAAVAAVGYLIYDNWKSIVDAGKALYDWIANAATKIWDFITSPFKMLGDWLKNSWFGKMFGGGDSKKTAGDDKSTVAGMKNPDGSPMTQGQMKSAMDRVAPIAGGKSDPNKYYNNLSPDQRRATDDAIVAQAKFAATQTGEPKSGYSKELVNTQTNAIDQNRLKESESVGLQRKQLSLLEDINNTNSAQLGVQSRTAGNQDNSTRYLKTISMNGPAA